VVEPCPEELASRALLCVRRRDHEDEETLPGGVRAPERSPERRERTERPLAGSFLGESILEPERSRREKAHGRNAPEEVPPRDRSGAHGASSVARALRTLPFVLE
jgi:hypothetical protein